MNESAIRAGGEEGGVEFDSKLLCMKLHTAEETEVLVHMSNFALS
jgi:hypothetical protein